MNPATPYADAGSVQNASAADSKVVLEGHGVPIVFCKTGDVGTIVSVSGNDKTRKFLNELGFTPGTEVKVVNQSGGNLILDVKGSKIAIDRTMANKIHFSPTS